MLSHNLKNIDHLIISSREYDERYIKISAYFEDNVNILDIPKEKQSSVDIQGIIQDATQLLEESPDLNIACWLLRAELSVLGFPALLLGLTRIHHLLETHGTVLHPIAEEGHACSDHGAALAWLATPSCRHCLDSARLHQNTEWIIKDFFSTLNQSNSTQEEIKRNIDVITQFDHEFSLYGHSSAFDAINHLVPIVENIETTVNTHTAGYILNISHISTIFKELLFSLKKFKEKNQPASIALQVIPINNGIKTYDNKISCHSRAEVLIQLAAIINYYQMHEPGHPAPVFIKRVEKMVEMDFESIVSELIPEANPFLSKITGNTFKT